jgi:hypothetical protein
MNKTPLNMTFSDSRVPIIETDTPQQTPVAAEPAEDGERILAAVAKASPRKSIRMSEHRSELNANTNTDKRINCFIKGKIHRDMRLACLQYSITIPELIERAMTEYLRDLKA